MLYCAAKCSHALGWPLLPQRNLETGLNHSCFSFRRESRSESRPHSGSAERDEAGKNSASQQSPDRRTDRQTDRQKNKVTFPLIGIIILANIRPLRVMVLIKEIMRIPVKYPLQWFQAKTPSLGFQSFCPTGTYARVGTQAAYVMKKYQKSKIERREQKQKELQIK